MFSETYLSEMLSYTMRKSSGCHVENGIEETREGLNCTNMYTYIK